ncbi:hypothetical protein HNR46_002604 [Haloferula luteola]|uniref:Uncharacterized protein n=1 Tax=Haloferula luteola TaxID=595692 RepID=A0A840VEV1_9BACT|nr:hypothetical protein [Haloferula luteola]MBB5352359.1 hypothetical protein [Haloferula luteola]
MTSYKNAITVFGFIVPALIVAVVLTVGFVARGHVQTSLQNKSKHFKGFNRNQQQVDQLEKQLSQKREASEYWNELLGRETASTITSHLRDISSKLPSKEFQITSQSTPQNRSGFGSASAQSSSQVNLGFRANFRSMQKAFLELETRMPQLQLQDLKISPSNQGGNLNIDASYTAWAP